MKILKRILTKKTGVTILEGLIAMGLLALIAAGTFGVLLSVSRKSSQPDIREEMVLAVEKANEQLQMYAPLINSTSGTGYADTLPDQWKRGLCGGDSAPMNEGVHSINCMLPPICDASSNRSTFLYRVSAFSLPVPSGYSADKNTLLSSDTGFRQGRNITFDITCNGFTL